ncbi:MAG: hypothetical protein FIB01_15090 [Gemmatimonadetes bacterium]|nr:hypothetical protein [Gemmatimonadota bacterium]
MQLATRYPLVLLFGLTLLAAAGPAQGQGGAAPPPARKIPGITVADPVPGACVDCHVNRVAENLDVRLSTIMRNWNTAVDSTLFARVQHTAPEGATLTGRHPRLDPEVYQSVPANCLECHHRASRRAPPFIRLMHAIHLQGGEANHFLTMFQGECTLCHKLNPATAAWQVPSGPEK